MSLLNPQEPLIPGTVAGDIFQAHMRRVGLLPEDEEERHARQQQHELEPYNPNPISNVRIGEEKTYGDIAKSGGYAGLAGGAKGIISAVESFGFGNDSTKNMIDHLDTIEIEHAPPESIQGELRNNPWMILDPTWWSYNVPNFAASTAPMMVGGGVAGLATKAIARMIPGLAGSAAAARTAFGGSLNMMTVGGGVYAEQVEQGKSHEEAARLSHQSMLVDAPFAYLEALLFLNPKLFAARLPKAMRSTTRKGHILQSSAIESFQEAGETIFADNMIQGKPWQTGVIEALISGPVVGGPIAAFQGKRGFDPAVMHAEKIEQLKVGEGIEGLNDPGLSTEEQLELSDRAADPAFSPQRVAWLEQRITREEIDAASKASGNDIPLGDAEWTDIMKDSLRLVGYFEAELDGRSIEELEVLRDDATRRLDRTIPLEHRTAQLMSDVLMSPHEAKRQGKDPLLYGDTFALTDENGVPDYTKIYRVTQLGIVQRDETGKPIVFGPDDPVPGAPRPPVGGVRAIDIASREDIEKALEVDPELELMDAARKELGVEIPDNVMIMILSRSRLRGKNMALSVPAGAAPEVPPLTSGVTGEVTPPPNNVVTSGRDARGRYAKPSIRDVRSGSEDPEATDGMPEKADQPVTEGGGQLATKAMDDHLVKKITEEKEVFDFIDKQRGTPAPTKEAAPSVDDAVAAASAKIADSRKKTAPEKVELGAEIDRRAEEVNLGHEAEDMGKVIRENFGDEAGDRFDNRIKERTDEAVAAREADVKASKTPFLPVVTPPLSSIKAKDFSGTENEVDYDDEEGAATWARTYSYNGSEVQIYYNKANGYFPVIRTPKDFELATYRRLSDAVKDIKKYVDSGEAAKRGADPSPSNTPAVDEAVAAQEADVKASKTPFLPNVVAYDPEAVDLPGLAAELESLTGLSLEDIGPEHIASLDRDFRKGGKFIPAMESFGILTGSENLDGLNAEDVGSLIHGRLQQATLIAETSEVADYKGQPTLEEFKAMSVEEKKALPKVVLYDLEVSLKGKEKAERDAGEAAPPVIPVPQKFKTTPSYFTTPDDPDAIAEIYRNNPIEDILQRVGPASSTTTARDFNQLKNDAKALGIEVKGKHLKSKQALATLIIDTVTKRYTVSRREAEAEAAAAAAAAAAVADPEQQRQLPEIPVDAMSKAEKLYANDPKLEGISAFNKNAIIRIMATDIASGGKSVEGEPITLDEAITAVTGEFGTKHGPRGEPTGEEVLVGEIIPTDEEVAAAEAKELEAKEEYNARMNAARGRAGMPPVRKIEEGVSGSDPGTVSVEGLTPGQTVADVVSPAAPEAAPEVVIEDILPTAKPAPEGFKRPVTGVHEKNPDDPPESFWREEIAPGVTRIQQMLDAGAPVLLRPWMTTDEQGRALVNQGFKRKGRSRKELTKPGLPKGMLAMGFPKEVTDAYYDFLEGRKTTTAPADVTEQTFPDQPQSKMGQILKDLGIKQQKEAYAPTPTPTPTTSVSANQPPRKLVVSGGRKYSDGQRLYDELDRQHAAWPIAEIVHGNASGADEIADRWAADRKIRVRKFPANWKQLGRKAGPMRNAQMAKYGDHLVAFPGDRGTSSMMNEMAKVKKPAMSSLDRQELFDIPGGVETASVENLETGKNHPALPGLFGEATPAAAPTPEAEVLEKPEFMPPVQEVPEGVSGEDVEVSEAKRAALVGQVKNLTDEQVLDRTTKALRKLATDVGVDPDEIKLGFYIRKSGKLKGQWVRSKPERNEPATRASLVYSIRKLFGQTQDISTEVAPEEQVDSSLDRGEVPAAASDAEVTSAEAFQTLTDKEILELSQAELIDDIETRVDMGGLGLGSQLWNPYVTEKGKTVKPNNFMKPNKRRLLEIIRSKYPYSAAVKQEIDKRLGVTPPSTEGAAPATAAATESQDAAEVFAFIEKQEPPHGMDDQDLSTLVNDEGLENAIAEARDKSEPMSEDEETENFFAIMQEYADMSKPFDKDSVSISDLEVTDADGKVGKYGKTSSGNNIVVWMEGEKRPRNIPATTLELVGTNMLRVKSKVQVSDQVISDARSLVRGVSDKNMLKLFKDKSGRTSLEEFKKWAKGIGATVPSKATRLDIIKSVRVRLAPAKGESNKQEPTDRGDILENFLRAAKKKYSLTLGPPDTSRSRTMSGTSGVMLQDGTFYDLGDEIHAEFMSRAYDEAFPLGPGTRFDAFKKEYTDFSERQEQENAWGIRDDVIQDFMADTGALRVSVGYTGEALTDGNLTIEGNGAPSSAQLNAMKRAVKSGKWSGVWLEFSDVAHVEIVVDMLGPRVASMAVANFWVKALEKQAGVQLGAEPRLDIRGFLGGQEQAAPIIYTSDELNPFADEDAERIALIAARFSPDPDNPQAWGRSWVLKFPNTEAARLEAFRIMERNSKVRLPAELRREAGLSAVPATAQSVLDIMDVPVEVGGMPEVGTPEFISVAAQAQNVVRGMVINGDAGGLAFLQTRIRKGVNKGDPMSIVVQNAIDMLRPTTLDSSFMPDPSDLQNVMHVEPPSWDVPLVDPLSESLAQQAVRNNINGVAPPNLDEYTQITIARAREVEWRQKFGPKPQILGNGVSRSLRNPHMYKANDDLLIRRPRVQHKGYKTLLHTVQRTLRKGVMKWQAARLQSKNPLEDIAVLGQVIRDARVENFILYYINDDNVVVGSTIISSRAPNSTENVEVIGWDFVAAKAGSLGATRIATSHNHPAGVPSPSMADLDATRLEGIEARTHGLEHMGHVIVDNTQYFELDPYDMEAGKINDGLKLLPPDIGKDLRRSPYLNDLTTPGLEAKAIHEAEAMARQDEESEGFYSAKTELIEMARDSVIRAHVGAGRSLSPEDRATYMYSLTYSAQPASAAFTPLSDVKAQVLEQATRIAHDNEVAVVVHLDVYNKITSVQSVDIETLRDEDTILDVIDKRVAGSVYTYVYLSSEAASRQTNTADGFDQNVEGFLNRLHKTDLIDGYVTQEVTFDADTDKNKQKQQVTALPATPQQDFRSVYANLPPDEQEKVLFALGNSPGLRAGELRKKQGLLRLVESNRKFFEKYRADGKEEVIQNFVNMGVKKGIDLNMLRMLAPGEDAANMPWREMTEKSFINRRSTPKRGASEQTGPVEVVSKVIRPVQKMIDATRNHETIPLDPNEPGVSHFRKFNMASLDNADKYTAAEETLARPETMMGRLFQDFEVKDFKGLMREFGNIVGNIGSGVGIRKSVLAGIKRVNPFMAKWMYDTEHALNVWVDLVNEHRLGEGGRALSAVANPRDALDLSRNVGGKIESKLKEYNSVLKIYNDGVGLNDQEMIDVSVYLAALQSKKRINTAEHRYETLEALKEERKDQSNLVKEFKAQLKRKNLDPATRKGLEDNLFTTQAYHAEIVREVKALRKLVVEEVIYDEDGNAIDKQFNPELINPGGATEETADAAMNEIEARLIKQLGGKAGAAKFEKLTDVAREMHVFWDGMLDISIDAGLVSREDAMYMKEANEAHGDYMSPFDIIRHYNTATMSGGGGPRNRSSMSVFDHQLYKHMVATTSESRDPILSSTDKISAIISFAAKNKATRTFHDTRLLWDGSGEVDPEIESVMMNLEEGDEVPKDFRRIYYWQDGKRVSFAAYAPIADVLLGLNRPVAGPIMRVVKTFTKFLRAGATALSPSFILWNIPRDLMTQYVAADEPLSPGSMKDIKLFGDSVWTALKASWSPETIDPLLEEFMTWGAGYGGEISQSMFTGTEEDIKKLRASGARRKKFLGRDIETGDATLDRMAKTTSWVMGMFNPFGSGLSLSEALEQGTRFAVFKKQLQASGVDVSVAGLKGLETTTDKEGRIVDSEGNVITAKEAERRETKRQKAIFAGRRATVDFSRGGKAFLYMNMMAPFTNAAVQGVRTVSGGVMAHPARAKAMMAAGALTAIVLNIMNRMNYGDLLDEEEDWKRRKSFTMIVGTWKDDQGEEHPISLHMPKGDLLSAVTVPFEDFLDHLYRAQSDPNVGYTDNAVGGMFGTMVEMFSEYSPVEFTRDGALSLGLIASKFLPTPVRATFETYTDKNFYFDREIEGRLKGRLTEDRIKRDTTELAVFMSGLAGSVFDITGDRETNPFSPVVIDHIVKSMAGEGGHIAASLLGKIGGAILSPQEALFGVAESFDAPWEDWVETAAYTPGIKRIISVRGGKQERLQMRTLERVQQIIGSRRAAQMGPVLELMRRRRGMTGLEFMTSVNDLGPEQLSMLNTEMEREAAGLGRTESVARTLRSLPIRTWGRAIGIIEIMNNNITRPIDRAEFIRGLAYAKLLTPMVMAQVMLLAGSGVLYRPDGVVPGAPGLRRVSDVRELSQPGFLPIMPELR